MEKLFPVRTALKALDSEPVGPKRKPHSEIISALPLIFAVKVISEVVAEEVKPEIPGTGLDSWSDCPAHERKHRINNPARGSLCTNDFSI
jgi:hypothetical protein